MSEIDFGSFSRGADAASDRYWNDIKRSREALSGDIGLMAELRKQQDQAYDDAAITYLSPLLADAQRAASQGTNMGEWYNIANKAILNDPNFQRMAPEVQQKMLEKWRAAGVTTAQNMLQSGDEAGALRVRRSLGFNYGPDNRSNPSEVFKSLGLGDNGWRESDDGRVWEGPQGQQVDAFRGASAGLREGQQGLYAVIEQAALEEALQRSGVEAGLYKEVRNASGRSGYRKLSRAERQLAQWQAQDAEDDAFLQHSMDSQGIDPSNDAEVQQLIKSLGDTRYINSIKRIRAKRRQEAERPSVLPSYSSGRDANITVGSEVTDDELWDLLRSDDRVRRLLESRGGLQ